MMEKRGWSLRKLDVVVGYFADMALESAVTVPRTGGQFVGQILQVLERFAAGTVQGWEQCVIDTIRRGSAQSAVDTVRVSEQIGILREPVQFVVGRSLAAHEVVRRLQGQTLRLIFALERDRTESPARHFGPPPHLRLWGSGRVLVPQEVVESTRAQTWHLQYLVINMKMMPLERQKTQRRRRHLHTVSIDIQPRKQDHFMPVSC